MTAGESNPGSLRDSEALASLRGDERLYREIVESSDDAILVKTPEGVIVSWNRGAERLYGYSAQEALDSNVSLIGPEERQGEELSILSTVLRGEKIEHYQTNRVTKDGQRIVVSMGVSALRSESGQIVGIVTIARDITARDDMERQLRYMADHDILTGLYNRRRFEQELADKVRYAKRYDRSGAVLMLDLDDFKSINDSFGHSAGDVLLKDIARSLKERVRETDVVARLGGDEFAILLSEVDRHAAVDVGLSVLGNVTRRYMGTDVAASVGVVAFHGEPRLTAEDLLVAADVALYQAKDLGRNMIAVYSGGKAPSLSWTELIRRALDEGHLLLDAQPILDVRSGAIVQEELLIRMEGEDGKPVSPRAFLPTAERFRLVTDIDTWVVDQAIQLVREGRKVSVNVSARSIGDRQFVAGIESRLKDSDVAAQNIVFELTETAAIANLNEAREFAKRLTELGCGFALDDFGTGFGSFSHLKHLPVTHLKVDMEFVRDLVTDQASQHVIQAVVALAGGFGQTTVAEGVEDQETLDALAAYGVDWAQGYHIGRPARLTGLPSGARA